MNQNSTLSYVLAVIALGWLAASSAQAQTQGQPASAVQADSASPAVAVDDCVIRFSEEVEVPATESGVLVEVLVQQNQTVDSGQVLARQNTDRLLLQKRIAQLQKKATDEKLADDLELQYAHTALSEAKTDLDSSRSIYENSAGAVPLSLLRKLRLAVERAELEVEREKKQRRIAQVEIDLRDADLQLLEQQLNRLVIKSPLPGVILELYRQSGEWVSSGDAVARVVRLDRLHAHCLASVDRLPPRSCQGQPVTVRWKEQGAERSLRGRVTSVDPELLAGGRYRLHAEIQNVLDGDRWRLLPGTEVTMTVHPGAASVAQLPEAVAQPRPSAGTR